MPFLTYQICSPENEPKEKAYTIHIRGIWEIEKWTNEHTIDDGDGDENDTIWFSVLNV